LEPWLEQHAGQLVSLRVKAVGSSTEAEFHLPFFKLQQLSRLDLEGLQVDFSLAAGSSSSSSTGTGPSLAKLQELKLHRCNFSHDALLQLAQLSGVTKLELNPSLDHHGGPLLEPEGVKRRLQQGLLQGMSNLECLCLEGSADAADIMPVVPANSLTTLTLHDVKLTDSASRLVNLRKLKLSTGLMTLTNPVALASMTLLTKLELRFSNVAAGVAAGVDGTISAFLGAVRGLRQLEDLEVFCSESILRAAEPRACSALTAASQLSYLDICSEFGQPLPATVLQHMFLAGKQKPLLKYIGICSRNDCWDKGFITTAELSSLVAACPALFCLDLTRVLAADADVSSLLKLPQQCQHLGVGGQVFGDEAAGLVAQLTQLQQLFWTGSPGLTNAGVAKLTALHMLYTLIIADMNLSDDDHVLESVSLKTKAGGQVTSKGLHPLLLWQSW
jgi:hypothetical protein